MTVVEWYRLKAALNAVEGRRDECQFMAGDAESCRSPKARRELRLMAQTFDESLGLFVSLAQIPETPKETV